ncbi:superfamily I DNA and RNA helicases: PROVISIONAL [Gigaspora margarita]|uniref:Superfamily I DNA and RNA helicases: PROVISIONAL n=1 Tax=Gigaspora margarita TaxID=4874 RepID=A0A8H3WYX1_GIGMA|nr:superfamily I DNA and RNA helicases: PROVISIONAL [Gigaspora margarita]
MSKQNAQLERYGGGETDDYSSDSDNFSDNTSECRSNNSEYGSNYESDTETSITKLPISQLSKVEEQISNTTYSTEQVSSIYYRRQENFDEKFTKQVLINKIHEIASSPARDITDKKDAPQEDMKAKGIKARDVFIRICCSFIKALYQILDCSWEEILKRLVIATSSDSSKCSYHLLYAPVLLIDYQELKEFIELVYKLTGEKYDKFIDRGLPGRNFNLRLIGFVKKDRVKRIFQFSLDNGIEKINIQKKITMDRDALKKYANIVLQKYSEYLGSWDIEEKNSQCKTVMNQGKFLVDGPKFLWPFLEMLAWAKYDSPLTVTETCEERYIKSLPKEGDVYIGSPWGTGKTYTLEHLTIPDAINLLALSTRHTYFSAVRVRLNLKSYCDIDTKEINLPEHQRVMRHIIVMDNDLTNLNIEWIKSLQSTELWNWAKQMSTLPFEERKSASLICHLRKDVQGIVYTLSTDFPELRIKKYHGSVYVRKILVLSFIWMENGRFSQKADMVVSIIEVAPKSEKDSVLLTEAVKICSSVIKAEKISKIANANILNYEMSCTPVKDIDDRNRYKVNNVKTCLNSPELIQYLQNLVPKMAQVFDNTDASHSTKKSGLKSDKAKLGLLNSALSAIYRIKFKTTNNKNTHYHLVRAFDNEDAPKLLPYQTEEGPFYEDGEDM